MNLKSSTIFSFLLMTIIFGTSNILAFKYFLAIKKHEPRVSLELKTGNQNYALIQNKQCVGKFNSSFSKINNEASLLINAQINFSYRAKVYVTNIKAFSLFNSLNQLSKFTLNLDFDQNKITVNTNRVSPILAELEAKYADRSIFKNTFELPGPLNLVPKSENIYELNYPIKIANFNKIGQETFQNLLLPIKTLPLDQFPCEQITAINLDPIILKLSKFTDNLQL